MNECARYTMAARLEQRSMRGTFTAICCVGKHCMPSFIIREIKRNSSLPPGYR